jgi:hypothetical protein
MGVADGTLTGVQQPSFEQRNHLVDPRQQDRRVLLATAPDDHVWDVAFRVQTPIPRPSVGSDRSAGFHALDHERMETRSRGVGDTAHPNAPSPTPLLLRGHHDERLVGLPAARMPFIQRPPVGLVHFHTTGQAIPSRTHHGPAKFVEPGPSRFIAPQPQDPLESQRARAGLLTGHPPHGPKPLTQRGMSVLEQRAGGDRSLIAADTALHAPRGQESPPTVAALRATVSIRPPDREEIASTSILCGEERVELRFRTRVFFHTQKHCP